VNASPETLFVPEKEDKGNKRFGGIYVYGAGGLSRPFWVGMANHDRRFCRAVATNAATGTVFNRQRLTQRQELYARPKILNLVHDRFRHLFHGAVEQMVCPLIFNALV